MTIVRLVKRKIHRCFFLSFYRFIVKIEEENHPSAGGGSKWVRKVDILELECGHKFWSEKDKDVGREGVERMCDNCFQIWLKGKYGAREGLRRYGWWDKWVRKGWA